MEKLLNEFTVNRPAAQTWVVLTDVERIAPCMPGAELHEIDGDVFKGAVKVKLGSIAAAFKGQASFVERDDVNHRAVLKGEGRDTGGKGNASALITASLQPITDTETKVVVETDLQITGRMAQFGRGIIGDVSKKLINQFANNLNTMLDSDTAASDNDTEVAAESTDVTGDAAAESQAAASSDRTSTTNSSGPRAVNTPAAEAIDLGGVAGTAVLKRALPFIGGLALLLLILKRIRRN